MHRVLTPQLLEQPIPFMITDMSSSAAMRLAVDQARATGLELVIIGYGARGWCGMCNSQLQNATFKAWFKGEVAYANSRGIEVSAYTLMQHNGWGEKVPEAEQTLSPFGQRGPTACFGTDWHAKYRQAVLQFIRDTGLTGLETDGQYEAIPCADKHGDHHHNGIEGGWAVGTDVTREFNVQLKVLGLYQTGADAYSFSGSNKWNHADTDAFSHLPTWEQFTVGRMYIYDSTISRLPSSGQIGVHDLASLSKNCQGRTRLLCFDFVLGTQYLMGSIPLFHAARLFDPADADAKALASIILKWTTFYKQYRGPRLSGASGLLVSKLIHIYRPDSRHLEAVLHATSDNSTSDRAMLVIVNPTQQPLVDDISVDLYYTGLRPGSTVTVSQLNLSGYDAASSPAFRKESGEPHVLGEDGAVFTGILLKLSLAPNSYNSFLIHGLV